MGVGWSTMYREIFSMQSGNRKESVVLQAVMHFLDLMDVQSPASASIWAFLDPLSIVQSGLTRVCHRYRLACCRHLKEIAIPAHARRERFDDNTYRGIVALAAPSLRILDLHHSSISTLAPFEDCTSVKSVDVSSCLSLGDITTLGAFGAMRSLRLDHETITHVNVLASCHSLQYLHLRNCPNLADISAIRHCSALRVVDMGDISNVNDLTALSHCPALESITLHDRTGVCRADFAVLFPCRSLTSITYSCDLSSPDYSLPDLTALAACASLRSLHLAMFNHDRHVGAVDMTPLVAIAHILTKLDLHNIVVRDMSPFQRFVVARTIVLEDDSADVGESFADLSPFPHCLDRLVLGNCSLVASLAGISNCIALRDLHIERGDRIGTLAPLTHLRHLELVTLVDFPLIDDIGPVCIDTLLELRLMGFPVLSDLSPLASCNVMTSLALHGCPIWDLMPVGDCIALTELELQQCAQIDDLSPLTRCKHLRSIALYDCDEIDDWTPLLHCVALDEIHSDADKAATQ